MIRFTPIQKVVKLEERRNNMINKEYAELLRKVIENNYKNIKYENINANEKEFYYEFKIEEKISENDFEKLEKEMKNLKKDAFVKLIRISGVYLDSNSNNEMITRITGKALIAKKNYLSITNL